MVEPIVLRFNLKIVSPVAILTGEELSLSLSIILTRKRGNCLGWIFNF